MDRIFDLLYNNIMLSWKTDRNNNSDENKNSFIDSNLGCLLRKENISQLELAEALSINPKTLRNYLAEPNSIPLSICDKLCNLFNRDFNDLFCFEKCDMSEMSNDFLNNTSLSQNMSELKSIRKSYIDAFDFFSDIKSKGFEVNRKKILDTIHKPLITMIGTKESDMNSFGSILLQKHTVSAKIPVYYVEKEDIPEVMRLSESIAIKTKKEESFDIFQLHDENYRNKLDFEAYDSKKEYTDEYVLIQISEAKYLSNCIILILPDLVFEECQRKTQLQTKARKLSDISIYYLIKFIPGSDIVLYFETIFNFFSVEMTPLLSYLINSIMRYGRSQIIFVETKCNEKDVIQFKEKRPQRFEDVLPALKTKVSSKKQFYDGVFSYRYYDNTNISDSEILDCVEHLCLDFNNAINLKRQLDEKVHIYFQKLSANYFYTKEKVEIKHFLQSVAESQDDEENTIESQKQEQLDNLKKNLEELENINRLLEIMSDNISGKTEMLNNNIQTLSKKIVLLDVDTENKGMRYLAIQLIFNNILIPYFLLEMTFAGRDKKQLAKRISEEIRNLKKSPYYTKIEALLSSGGLYE